MQEVMFDANVPGCFRSLTKREKQHIPKPPTEVDVFMDKPDTKLWYISMLDDDEYGSLELAIDSIRHFFYGDRDKYSNKLLSYDDRGASFELYYEMSCYLLDNEQWITHLRTCPMHECYTEFVRPLRQYIKQLLAKENNYEI